MFKGRWIGARPRLTAVQGGASSPAKCVNAVLAMVWLGSWHWNGKHDTANLSRGSDWLCSMRSGDWLRAAALPNYGKEFSHARRERERGKGHGVFVTIMRC